ncbi:MAG TPA: hypothetical protein VLV50_03590 [Stellaceae bacterium]|nr:hypothetical protein [Stellaceae bacterium]
MRRAWDWRTWLAGATLLGAAARAAEAGAPFRTDDPVPDDYQHGEVYFFSTATHVDGDTSGTLPGIDLNYGVLPDMQLHAIAPLAFDAPSGNGKSFGAGDTELGIKYRFMHEDESGWRPQIAIFPTVELPTGSKTRGLGTGSAQFFLPVWIQKTFGAWTTYGGGGYWHNPGAGNKDYWFTGWLVQRQVTDALAVGAELFHQTADTVGGSESTGFNIGAIYDFSENYNLLVSAGRGLENAAKTNAFSYYAAFQWTF